MSTSQTASSSATSGSAPAAVASGSVVSGAAPAAIASGAAVSGGAASEHLPPILPMPTRTLTLTEFCRQLSANPKHNGTLVNGFYATARNAGPQAGTFSELMAAFEKFAGEEPVRRKPIARSNRSTRTPRRS